MGRHKELMKRTPHCEWYQGFIGHKSSPLYTKRASGSRDFRLVRTGLVTRGSKPTMRSLVLGNGNFAGNSMTQ